MSKPWVYIASPYTQGDQALNVRFQARVWDELRDDGIVLPIAPLWSHFQHMLQPRRYQDWIDYDLELLERVDAVLRMSAVCVRTGYLQSDSDGAEGEVDHAAKLGIPVFYSINTLYEWVANEGETSCRS